MAFNELLWSVHPKVVKRLIEEKGIEKCSDITPYNDLPGSTKVFIEEFELIFNEYKTLKDFIDASTGCSNPSILMGKAGGLYVEAFCNGLSSVLLDFNQILLDVEESRLSESGISMLEISSKLQQYASILPSLTYAVNQIKGEQFRGCKILDLCENLIIYSPHFRETAFRKIQKHCLKQFYKQTKLWIMQARLYDPFCEFFITPAEKGTSFDPSVSSLTACTTFSQITNNSKTPVFQVQPENLPNMIPLSVAMKIHFIGEALTVCQYNEAECRNNDRILSVCGINEQRIASQFAAIEESEKFSLKNLSCLIDDLWIGVNKYIRQISDEIGKVKDQLVLMWEIYLLGRGELFQEFLLKGSALLNTAVSMVDSRNLNIAFKDAVYYVYLSDYSDLTDQFFFELPNKKALRQGQIVWSVMELKCNIKWPLQYLFTRDVMKSYNKLFIFLLRLKKAQIDVTSTWKRINSIKNYTLRRELIEMRMHLLAIVGNLQNYCFTNVIASEMTTLLDSVKNSVMFTDLQKALHLFLTNISNRLFLPDASLTRCSNFDKSIESIETVNKCFRTIFALCGSFSELDGKNYENIMSELTALKTKLEKILKILFALLNKIDQSCHYDGYNSTSHLYNLMMCLDYNTFFRNKFKLSSFN